MARDSSTRLETSTALSCLGQHLVTLSNTNRDALLSEATQLTFSDASRTRAEAILSRLRDLNPDVAQQFHPKQDALASLRLRMICETPQSAGVAQSTAEDEAVTVPAVSNVPSYIAVSYCWHYPQWPLAPAATPIVPAWEVSRPMMDAVMALRNSPDEGVWLDKLCINQSDDADTKAHIGVMDIIYRSARRIAILLEDVQLDSDEEDAGLAYSGFYQDLCREVQDGGLEGEEKAQFIDEYFPRRIEEFRNSDRSHILAAIKPFAHKILGARWYERGWCAHESRISKHQKIDNPLFMCFGSDGRVLSFEFRFVHYLGMYLSDSEPRDSLVGAVFMEKLNDPVPKSLRQLWWRIQRLMPDRGAGVSAMQHLVSILSFDCLKKGDLLSIALNTAGIPVSFVGEDVQSVEQVIWKFSLLVLASGDLVPLVAIGKALRIPTASGREVISWAVNPVRGVLEDSLPNPLPESITAIMQEYIELDLLVFESTPKGASLESEAKATALITDHNLNTIADALLSRLPEETKSTIQVVISEMTRIKQRQRLSEIFRHRVLSLAIDNGLDWILDFPEAMRQATAETWAQGSLGEDINPDFAPAAQSLLSLLLPESNHTTSSTTTQPSLDKITQSLTTLLDPRLFLLTVNPRNLPLSPSLGTAALTSVGSNTSYIAVPAALAHLPGWYKLAWAIEPFDPDGPEEKTSDMLPPADLRIAKEGEDGGGGEGGGCVASAELGL